MDIDLRLWNAIPVFEIKNKWDVCPYGLFRRKDINGKPMVVFNADPNSNQVNFAIRPFVRVPMRRREN